MIASSAPALFLGLQRISSVSPLAYVLAFGGGVISFLSPCVLPLVPGYLSIVTGLDLVTLREGSRRYYGEILVTTGLFVLGFGTVFVLLGFVGVGSRQRALIDHQNSLTHLGSIDYRVRPVSRGPVFLRPPWLYGELRFHPQVTRYGRGAPLLVARPSPLDGHRAWARCSAPSSRSWRIRTARGRRDVARPRTRSASVFRSSRAG